MFYVDCLEQLFGTIDSEVVAMETMGGNADWIAIERRCNVAIIAPAG